MGKEEMKRRKYDDNTNRIIKDGRQNTEPDSDILRHRIRTKFVEK